MRRLSQINQVPLFQEIPEAIAEEYLANCMRRAYRKRDLVFQPRQHPDYVYLLTYGKIRVYLSHETGKEFTLTILEQGDVYSGHTRVFGTALEDTEILFIPKTTFRTMLVKIPAFAVGVLAVLGDALNSSMNIIENLAFHDVNQRLWYYLLDAARKQGEASTKGLVVKFGLTHEEIATMIGTTRQTVSQFFNALQKDGLLTVGKGLVIIGNLKHLEDLEDRILKSDSH